MQSVSPWWHYLRLASHLIGLALLVWIVAQLDLKQAGSTLATADARYLGIYVALYAGAVALRVLRLRWVLARQGFPISLRLAYIVNVEAAILAMSTPGRAGEAVKIVALRQANVPVGRGFFTVVLERVFDLAVFLLLAFGGALYFADSLGGERLPVLLSVLAVGVIGLILFVCFRHQVIARLGEVLERLAARWGGMKSQSAGSAIEMILKGFKDTWRGTLVFSLLIGALGALQVYCLALALGLKVGLLHLTFSYSVASLVALAPVSINGLGTREATYIFLLGLESVKAESALLLSLLDGILLPLLMVCVLAMPLWISGTISLKRTQSSRRKP